MNDLAVVIPSIRENVARFAGVLIDSINNSNSPYSYEIIVVSPFRIRMSNVRWIKDTKTDGSVSAVNLGAQEANAEVICICPDDYFLQKHWWLIYDFIKIGLRNSFYKISGFTHHKDDPPYLHEGKYPIATHPCFLKNILDYSLFNGNIFNPKIKHQYCDIELGMTMYLVADEPIKVCPYANYETLYGANCDLWNNRRKNQYILEDCLTLQSIFPYVKMDCHAANLPEVK